jgi:hypothetical protein
VVVHPRLETALTLVLHRMCRHRDDRETFAAQAFANPAARFEAVHLGHLHVHEDGIEACRVREDALDGDAPVLRHLDRDPEIGQQSHGDLLIDLVILGE